MKKLSAFFLLILIGTGALSSQERFRKSPPFADPLPELNLPMLEPYRLSNGLTISVAQRRNFPFISMQLVILTGESSSPQNLPGLATFTADLFSRGTLLLSASDVEERIESFGGSFSASTSLDYSLFNLNFLEEYLDQALDMLSLTILQPAFLEREIFNVKRMEYYNLLEKNKDPDFVAKRQLLRLLFQNHPYKGSFYNEDVIKNISKKDVLLFFDQHYRPNNAILILTGNLNLPTASRKVSHYLNTWAPNENSRSYLAPPEPNAEEKICFVDLPQAKDVTIYWGMTILPMSDPDYFPFAVLNQVLGGTPNSRLFMNLRESKGYAYFAFSEVEFYRSCGVFFVRTRVTPPAVAAAVQEIGKEMSKTAKENLSTFEIEQAKSYLIGNFPLQIERFDLFTSRISELEAFNLGSEFWNAYYENIMVVDSARVSETAQKYLSQKPLVIIVGDKNVLGDHLKEFDKIEVYDQKGYLQYTITKGVQ